MSKYTNDTGIPLSLAVWLAMDEYEHTSDPYTISATSLLKPTRELILGLQNSSNSKSEDISNRISSRFGSDLHAGLEKAWKHHYQQAMLELGYPQSLVDRMVINPTELTPNCVPVYVEERVKKQLGKWTITGQFDLIIDGELNDLKSTGVYTYIKQTNTDKYIKQCSIYRWLNPEKVTKEYFNILYAFTDWSNLEYIKNKEYPATRVLVQKYNLLSLSEIESFIRTKLQQLEYLIDKPQSELPRCTPDELWMNDPPVFKYYKNPLNKSRSTKNFDNEFDAQQLLAKDGFVGEVVKVMPTPKACSYCSVREICDQAKEYFEQGLIKGN